MIFELSGNGRRVSIVVFGYERETSDDIDDAQWLDAEVELHVPPFGGKYRAALMTTDLASFRDELQDLLHGVRETATLSTLEEWLSLNVSLDSKGGGRVAGRGQAADTTDTYLSFAFSTDQTYLHHSLRTLSALVAKFPVR